MDKWFVINNLSEFTDKARAIVYNNFGSQEQSEIESLIDEIKDSEKEEFDRVLSHNESLVIVKQSVRKQKHKQSNKTRYILNDKLFMVIIENLNSRLISNILNGLVQKGLIESAFDSETNDFVFWIKDNNDQK